MFRLIDSFDVTDPDTSGDLESQRNTAGLRSRLDAVDGDDFNGTLRIRASIPTVLECLAVPFQNALEPRSIA
jgi:hypothetical protein